MVFSFYPKGGTQRNYSPQKPLSYKQLLQEKQE
jgi:hypothetical protein